MTKEYRSNREVQKKAGMSLKEKRAAKKAKKDTRPSFITPTKK